ncbi:MAG: FtsX-like permease family protein, partial [Melioribacteraceae bacterium]
MLKNYIKIAARNFLKYKSYSFINITGLAIGFTCSFLISFYVIHELSFDSFNTKSDRIYRLLLLRDNEEQFSALTSAKYAPFMENEFPEIEKTARFFTNSNSANIRYENTSRKVTGFYFADSTALQIFDYKLIAGNPLSALNAPNKIVLSKREADAWFGNENPVGKKLVYFAGDIKIDIEVTGVFENVPSNSHLQFDYLVSFTTFKTMRGEEALTDNTNYNHYTYLLLRENAKPGQVENRFPYFFQKTISPDTDNKAIAKMQPLSDIHLNNDITWNINTTGNPQFLYIFSAVAVLVLFIAIVNFVNLSTARATLRAKEVGVRKTIGAERKQIIYQLFSESLLTSIIALAVSILVQEYLIQILAYLTEQNLSFNIFENVSITILFVAIGLFGGLLAGIYPAIVLSSFQPTKVLKGEITRGTKGVLLRKGLIISQFAISIWLIISVLIVSDQLDYMKNKKLGFNKSQVILFDVSANIKTHFDAFRNRLISNTQIKDVSLAGIPGRVGTSRGYNWPGSNGEETGMGIYTK